MAIQLPTWQRVTNLADLVEIFEPAVQICVWPRDMDAAVSGYPARLERTDTPQTIFGKVPLEQVIGTGRFDFARAAQSPGWLAEIRGEHTPETEEYGIGSFVYRARRPFHPARFAEALKSDWPGNVLRSKGFFWLASRPDAAGEWSQAGGIVRHGPAGIWWAAAPREHWPKDAEHIARIEAVFDGEYGDRRQEIVFIGQNLEPEQTREILDRCLLSDEEMAAGLTAWRALDDPFPRWFAEKNED